MYIGDKEVTNIYIGDKPVVAIYLNGGNIFIGGDRPIMTSSPTFEVVEGTEPPIVGTITATDPNGQDLTFELINTLLDGALFTMDESNEVSFNSTPNHDIPLDIGEDNTYEFWVKITNEDGKFTKRKIMVFVINSNVTPNDIMLDNDSVLENAESGTLVGTFTASGLTEPITYSLVSGEGDTYNGSFDIVDDELITFDIFNYEEGSTKSIRVAATDGETTVFKTFLISITNVLEPPNNIILSKNSIIENNSIGDTVATLSTVHTENLSAVPTYAMAAGTGDTDNASFEIDGNALKAAEIFDKEIKATYSIRISTTTGAGTFSKAFTITITEVNEAPVFSSSESFTVLEMTHTIGAVLATDPELTTITYSVVGGNDASKITINSSNGILSFNDLTDYEFPSDYDGNNEYDILVKALDTSGLFTIQTVKVTVTDVDEYDIYVDPINGEDTNNGTFTLPLKTLERGISVAIPGTTIYLREGEYNLISSVNITKSGLVSKLIDIRNFPGETPVISGFQTITSWTEDTLTNVFKSNIDCETRPNVVILSTGGEYTQKSIGRYPQENWFTYTSPNNGYTIAADVTDTNSWTGAQIVLRKNRWIIDAHPVTNKIGSTIYYSDPRAGLASVYKGEVGYGYFYQEDDKTLLYDNAWNCKILDKVFKMYFTEGSPGGHTVKVSRINNLINIQNESYISFNGIVFEGANSIGISVDNCSNISVTNCTFRYIGDTAVKVEGTSPNFSAIGNTLSNINNNGIVNPYGSTSNNSEISGNTIDSVAMIAGMMQNHDGNGFCIALRGSGGVIEGNTITNAGYLGILPYGDATVCNGNKIDGFCKVKDDGSAINIYDDDTTPLFKNVYITNNHVLNGIGSSGGTNSSLPAAYGIYMDGYTRGVYITGNTVHDCASGGILLGIGTSDITVENNNVYNNAIQLEVLKTLTFDHPINYSINNNVFAAYTPDQILIKIYTYPLSVAPADIGTWSGNYYIKPLGSEEVARATYKIGSKKHTDGYSLEGWKTYDATAKAALTDIPRFTVLTSVTGNLFANPTFESSRNNFDRSYSGTATPAHDTTSKLDGTGTAKVTVSALSTDDSELNCKFQDMGAIVSGKTYLFNVSTLGVSANKSMNVHIRQADSPFAYLSEIGYYPISNTRVDSEILLKSIASASAAHVYCVLRDVDANGSTYFDTVSFKEVTVEEAESITSNCLVAVNETAAEVVYPLDNIYLDLDGTEYATSITLPANTSKFLVLKNTIEFVEPYAFTPNEHQLIAGSVNAGEGVVYSISGGADASKFAINPATGELTFLVAPDYEIPTDVGLNNVYNVTIKATKDGFASYQAYAVTVQDVATDDVVFPIASTGDGSGYATFNCATSTANMTIYVTGANAMLYDDAGGTNPQTSKTVASQTNVYVKVTSGSGELRVKNGNITLTKIRGWDASTNAPTISGFNLSALPATVTEITIPGNNTVTGALNAALTGLTTVYVEGSNTISGNLSSLPATLTSFLVAGSNTIAGNLSSLPSGLTLLYIAGSNTVSGNLSSLSAMSGLTRVEITGSNTVTGDLASLPASVVRINIQGSNTINAYTASKNWADAMQLLYIETPGSGTGLSAAMVDNICIDLDNTTTNWAGSKMLYIRGTGNHGPTITSAAARASLASVAHNTVTVLLKAEE